MTNWHFTHEIISVCPDPIIAVNREGIITLFNDAAETLTGWRSHEVLNKCSIARIYTSLEAAKAAKKFMYGHEYGGPGRLEGYEAEGQTRDGRIFPIRLSAVVLYKEGKEVGSVGFFHDLSARKKLENELRKLSITDSLTGLYNRRHFQCTLSDEVGRCERYGRPLSLIFFDLDHFKSFNDSFGHQQGDQILLHTSNCVKTALRAQDYAFRHGGDEFALLLVETDLENAAMVAERFRTSFNNQWSRTMAEAHETLPPISLSLGVAQHLTLEDAKSLLMRADLAMYEAKQAGGNRTVKSTLHLDRSLWSIHTSRAG